MADLSHERDRLYKLVDAWIEAREGDGMEDARISQAAVIAVVDAVDDDGDAAEGVFTRFESSRQHVQLGLLRVATLRTEDQ